MVHPQQKQVIKVSLKPENIAEVVCWLASDDAKMMTGQTMLVDGGRFMH